ncbi:MAG: fibronectin type III domain-containing protein [Bdellovibrionota bacterium]
MTYLFVKYQRYILAALLILLPFTGCLKVKKGPDAVLKPVIVQKVMCSNAQTLDIRAAHFKQKSEVTYTADSLSAFANGQFHESVVLLKFRGRFDGKSNLKKMRLAINGQLLTREDGFVGFDGIDAKDSNWYVVRLEKTRVHGQLDTSSFIKQIANANEDVVFRTQIPNFKVLDSRLEIFGYVGDACIPTGPGPGPDPEPVAPVVKIDSVNPTGAVTDQSSMQISFSANQGAVTFTCSLDNAVATPCESPITYSNLMNGAHSFEVKGRNADGLVNASPVKYQWSISAPIPSVTIIPITSPNKNSNILVGFTSSKPGKTYCVIDGGSAAICTSPLQLTNLSEGQHSVAISAVDNAGNVGAPAEVHWLVDVTAPAVQISAVSPIDDSSASITRSFTFNADESSLFECSMDEGDFSSCLSPVTLSDLSEGNHLFQVRAIDAAGNVSSPATSSWTSDYTKPELSLLNVTPASEFTNSLSFSVDFSANETTTYICSIDDGPASECTSPYAGNFGGDGAHFVTIVAKDSAGLVSEPKFINWDVNTSAGTIAFESISPSSAFNLNSPVISLLVSSPAGSNLWATVNGEPVAINGNMLTLMNLSEGQYNIEVNGSDQWGNNFEAINHSFIVDVTNPVISYVVDPNIEHPINVDSISLDILSNEAMNSYECNVDSAGFNSCSDLLTFSGLSDGNHLIEIRGSDLAGNVGETSFTFIVDTIAPQINASAVQTSSGNFKITVTASEEIASLVCDLDGANYACSIPETLITLSPGTYNFTVKGFDAAGNFSAEVLQLVVIEPPPVTNLSTSVPLFTNSSSASFSFSSDNVQNTFRCSLDDALESNCASPTAYNNLTDGNHKFKVQAVSASGKVDPVGQTYQWTVDASAPLIMTSSYVGMTNRVQVNATFNEPVTMYIKWGVGLANTTAVQPLGTSFSVNITGLAAGTTYAFQIYATDRAGNVTVGPIVTARTRN